jgi:predicted aspartyl protease
LTHVYVKAVVKGPKGNKEVPELLVDTGATFTVLPIDILRGVGASLQPVKKKLELGDGRFVEADTYSVVLAIQDREDVTFAVTFKDAKPVLGVRTLADLGFKVDPVAGSLEPTRPPGSAFYYRTGRS